MSDIITVDAGHTGSNYNKGAAPGYYESAVMWDLHQRFAEALAAYGPATRLTRTTLDANPGLIARGEMAKGSKAFISFHSNAEATGKASYPLGIYFVDDNCGPIDEESKELAQMLSNTVAETIGTEQAARIWTRSSSSDRDGNGYKDDYYGVLRGAHSVGVPGVILECGFHTHAETAAWLMKDDNRQKLAEALAKTTADFYGYSKKTDTAPVQQGMNATEPAMQGPSDSIAGTYKVTANSGLNIRNGAGTKANTFGKDKHVLVTIPKGTKVRCWGYYTEVNGVKWLYVEFTYGGVAYTGFACATHLKKV